MKNTNLEKLQNIELDILKSFDAFCKEHDLKYYLIDGTLLGAVRHKGFIPWDDDVDTIMPRKDYDRFVELARKGIYSYEVANYSYGNGYEKFVTRVINKKVRIYHDSYAQEEEMPSWIDVFPLDGMPNNPILRKIHQFYFLFIRMLYHFSCFDKSVNLTRKDRSAYQKILIWFGKTFKIGRNLNTLKLIDKLERILKKYPVENSKYVVNAYSSYMFKETYEKKWFGKGIYAKFEDGRFILPSDSDSILSHLYGDYMTPPPDDKKEKHHITRIEFE